MKHCTYNNLTVQITNIKNCLGTLSSPTLPISNPLFHLIYLIVIYCALPFIFCSFRSNFSFTSNPSNNA